MTILQGFVEVDRLKVFYRESGKDVKGCKGNVMLLHGARFSSSNWEEISTLKKIAELNFHAIALDLPGYGKSKETLEPKHKAEFLKNVCKALSLNKVILISPSMSGTYSIPFLHEYPSLLQAYIPIAPVSTEKFTIQQYKSVSVPTFIVYGENDDLDFVENAIKLLKYIPESKEMRIKDAGHPCYLHQPAVWHRYLENIVSGL